MRQLEQVDILEIIFGAFFILSFWIIKDPAFELCDWLHILVVLLQFWLLRIMFRVLHDHLAVWAMTWWDLTRFWGRTAIVSRSQGWTVVETILVNNISECLLLAKEVVSSSNLQHSFPLNIQAVNWRYGDKSLQIERNLFVFMLHNWLNLDRRTGTETHLREWWELHFH